MKIKTGLICIFLLLSCKTAEFSLKTLDVNGMVYDFSNRPVAHCQIIIGGNYKTSTDINGRFSFSGIPVGAYVISGEKRGFESYYDTISVRERGQIVYFRIPSQNQLLLLADEALTVNDFEMAEEMLERAYWIDSNNIEMLFYYAVLKFKQHRHEDAIAFLEMAKYLGSRDFYVDKFLTILKEEQNAN